MDREVKIRLSVGLIAAVAMHAVLLAFVFTGLHQRNDVTAPWVDDLTLPNYEPPAQYTQPPISAPSSQRSPSPALNELKQAGGELKGQSRVCIPCVPTYTVPQPYYPPSVPFNQPSYRPPQSIPAPSSPVAPKVTERRAQIALFLDGSPKSRMLESWFQTDPKLVAVRQKTEFQIYTPNNALYRTRYAEVVPESQFPAILFLKSDGGHIHAAGGNMLPESNAQLYADLQESYRLSQSVANAPGIAQTGALRERGYNWDAAIAERDASPQWRTASDCEPGMLCPDESRRPILPWLVDSANDRSAVLWAGDAEIGIVILTLAAVALIGVILYRRL